MGSLEELAIAPLPRVLWIELSSKCPFDCIFCSRAAVRGAGEHLAIDLHRQLLRQIGPAEVLRLNYSGESTHHPHFIEALRLAAETGAVTELVSAFASFPLNKMRDFVETGLDRLTLSLHTLKEERWSSIYRYASVAALLERLDRLEELKGELSTSRPRVDLAFVALQRNLDELVEICAFASARGIHEVAVHPVIRRDGIEETLDAELSAGRMREDFRMALARECARAEAAYPDVRISVSTPELEESAELTTEPQSYPQLLPSEGRIASCDQSPFDTTHVLSNGDLVPCEVQDRRVMGNLRQSSLQEIWHGEAYMEFRREFSSGADPKCRACAYKKAYLPTPRRSRVRSSDRPGVEFLRGWHARDEQGTLWSRPEAALVLRREPSAEWFHLKALLPPGGSGAENELRIRAAGAEIGGAINRTQEFLEVDRCFPLPPSREAELGIELRTSCASRSTDGRDARSLGIALIEASIRPA